MAEYSWWDLGVMGELGLLSLQFTYNFVTGVKFKVTGDSKLNDSPVYRIIGYSNLVMHSCQ